MALLDFKNFGKYQIWVECDNCGKNCKLAVKKGVPVGSYIAKKQLFCDYCGCLIEPKTYETDFTLKQDKNNPTVLKKEDTFKEKIW
jgi:hypothetical protein